MSGFLGQSPDFWQNLAAFGGALGAAANQRTAGGFLANGTGLAGPLSVGAGNFVQSERQGEALRSQIAQQAANTQNLQSEVALRKLQIPLLQNMIRRQQNFYNWQPGTAGNAAAPGAGVGNPFGGGTQSASSVIPPEQRPALLNYAVAGTPVPPAFLNAVVEQESGWNPAATSKTGAIGLGQILPSTAKDPGFNLPSVDPSYITGPQNASNNLKVAAHYLYARGKAAGVTDWTDPAQQAIAAGAYHSAVDNPRYEKQVMGRMQAPGVPPSAPQMAAPIGAGPNALPSSVTATAPEQPGGAAPAAPQVPGQQPMPAPPIGGPTLAAAGLPQYQPGPQMALPPMQQQPAPGGFAPLRGVPSPAAAMQMANQADAYANHYAAGAMAGIPGADVAAQNWRARAQQYRTYALAGAQAGSEAAARFQYAGPTAAAQQQAQLQYAGPIAGAQAAAKLPYQTNVLRGQGSVLAIGGKPVLQVPLEVHGVGPNGEPITRFIQPIEGASANSANLPAPYQSGISPGKAAGIKEAGEQFSSEASQKAFHSAEATIGWTEQMEHALDTLNASGGWSSTGTTAPIRLEISKTLNSLASITGAPLPADADKVASYEALAKYTKVAGMALVNSMFGGSREAASIINGATSAVPNVENTPQGAKLVLNGIREASKHEIDLRNFQVNWFNGHNGNLVGSEEAFNQQYSPAKYAMRAISMVKPYKLTSADQMKRYLPGTHFVSVDGVLRAIPGSPDVLVAGVPAP